MRLRSKILQGVVCCLAGATVVGAVHGQQVSTDYDHKASFTQYHTFSFYRVQTADPLYKQRVQDAITQKLQSKGLQMVSSGGDLAITAIGDVKTTQEYNTFYTGLGPGFGWGGWGGWGGRWGGGASTATTTAQQIPVGTLMVDLYDTKTHNLVYRGRASDELHQKHTDKNIKLVNKSVDKMFDHFPPDSDK